MTEVKVAHRAAERVASGHPWIYASDVIGPREIAPGSVVRVVDPQRKMLGSFHYSSKSQIALRQLSSGAETVDAAFFRSRLEQAEAFRREVVSNTSAYRLVHGEADLLPALVVDRYQDCFVLQTLSQGMEAAKSQIGEALQTLFSPVAILERNDTAVRAREGLEAVAGVLRGEAPDPVEFQMNGLRWGARLLSGQKTGVFLDQRENYLAARRFARGSVLDCFTYTGGFALHLAAAGLGVEAVDSSAEALETARQNAARNGLAGVEFRQADVFELLAGYGAAGRRFDAVILDPPAFARSRSHLEAACRHYQELNRRALRLLERGGVLLTCSCSHHLSEAQLLELVAQAALDAGRRLRVLERRTQSLDHPILLTVPETHYLKCLILQVV